jgi:hypothetical protein
MWYILRANVLQVIHLAELRIFSLNHLRKKKEKQCSTDMRIPRIYVDVSIYQTTLPPSQNM